MKGENQVICQSAAEPDRGGHEMALIRKQVSGAFVAANRASSRKSTGPQTKPGKVNSSRNAIKLGVFCKLPMASMREQGEKLAAFEELRESLFRAFCPADGLSRGFGIFFSIGTTKYPADRKQACRQRQIGGEASGGTR